MIEADFVQILADSQIRNTDPNRGRTYAMYVGAPNRGWVPSGPELEARRRELLGRARGWEPLFRLLFPHPAPEVTKRLEENPLVVEPERLLLRGAVQPLKVLVRFPASPALLGPRRPCRSAAR